MFSDVIRQDYLQSQIRPVKPASSNPTTAPASPTSNTFSTVLQQQLREPTLVPLTFSGHALQRLQQRQISLSAEESTALSAATAKAREKGAKETLILAEKAAFVVSVTNNMVITVMDRENPKDNLFTQIDSAIII